MADSAHKGGLRLPLHGDLERSRSCPIEVDGTPMLAYEGETLAATLVAHGFRIFRITARGRPRGLYCGIGFCYDCLLTVDGRPNIRACMTHVAPGMKVETGTADAWGATRTPAEW